MNNKVLIAFFSLCTVASCAADFAEYNQVTGLRVLAIRATPPELIFEDESTLDILSNGEISSYKWSWCPFDFSDPTTGECPIPEDQFRAFVAMSGAQEDPPPYDLGNGNTATFKHTLPAEFLEGLCEQVGMVELPAGFTPPPCDGRWDIQIRLVVSGPEGTIISTRPLSLLYADLPPNQNPTILGGELSVPGAPPFPFTDEGATQVSREVGYRVELDVPESSAEEYEGLNSEFRREGVSITWFYQAGSMDKGRSSFIDGSVPFSTLRENVFTTPSEEDRSSDSMRLFFVIRDNRDGLDWFVADLEMTL